MIPIKCETCDAQTTIDAEHLTWRIKHSGKCTYWTGDQAGAFTNSDKRALDIPVVDMINHPPHYTKHPSGVECITVTEQFNFNLGNVIKYVWRADDKNDPIENLRKAEFYLKREIARRERERSSTD